MTKITARVQTLSTEQMKELALNLNVDFRDEAGDALSAVTSELMGRLPEAQFVDFCHELEG